MRVCSDVACSFFTVMSVGIRVFLLFSVDKCPGRHRSRTTAHGVTSLTSSADHFAPFFAIGKEISIPEQCLERMALIYALELEDRVARGSFLLKTYVSQKQYPFSAQNSESKAMQTSLKGLRSAYPHVCLR